MYIKQNNWKLYILRKFLKPNYLYSDNSTLSLDTQPCLDWAYIRIQNACKTFNGHYLSSNLVWLEYEYESKTTIEINTKIETNAIFSLFLNSAIFHSQELPLW